MKIIDNRPKTKVLFSSLTPGAVFSDITGRIYMRTSNRQEEHNAIALDNGQLFNYYTYSEVLAVDGAFVVNRLEDGLLASVEKG